MARVAAFALALALTWTTATTAVAQEQPVPDGSVASSTPDASPSSATAPVGSGSNPAAPTAADPATTQPPATASTPAAPQPAPATRPVPSPSTPSQGPSSPPPTRAPVDPINDRWLALGGATGLLGSSVGPRVALRDGQYQSYARGVIWWTARTGAWETWGDLGARFAVMGYAAGPLGFPLEAQRPSGPGVVQSFEGGRIWWLPGLGAWDTWGDHWRRYEALGGPGGFMGFPVGGQYAVGAGFVQDFQGGRIWWLHGLGAVETWGDLGWRFNYLGGATGVLGFPTGSQRAWGGGVVQPFQGGHIWWLPGIGPVETWGDVDRRFVLIGGPGSGLGFPLRSHDWLARDGGSYQQFQTGTIHWSARTGALETMADFERQWAEAGWENGSYGYPVSGMYPYLGGGRQDFQGGSILAQGVQPVLDPARYAVSAADVWATWRPGCPVGPESLTLIRLNYWGFDNVVHRGEIIVRADLVGRVENAFAAALDARFPIRRMWRADHYGGNDPASMAADNTSGFNCRQVTGGTGLSPHSYGIAVDVNTVENPYLRGIWWPSAEYVDRNNVRPGMLFASSAMTVAFRNNGYSWGASFRDYQHFQFVG